jgi:hypothetical protein
MTLEFKAQETVFPVIGADWVKGQTEKRVLQIRQVCGTAFSIGGGFFATAEHVLRTVSDYEAPQLGIPHPTRNGEWSYVNIDAVDLKPEVDLGILSAKVPHFLIPPWDLVDRPMLSTVRSVGYPYALDDENGWIMFRAFQGYITALYPWTAFSARPLCYELSFQVPRGLSGAPLIMETESGPKVGGMLVGNRSTEMLVYTTKEVLKDKKETVVERYESLQLGIAVRTISLLDLHSEILGGTIKEHLSTFELA